jgi:hypothetical protein
MRNQDDITFTRVKDTTTVEQKSNIWDWVKDHAENFGGIPLEYAEWDESEGSDVVFNYDQMLSALTEEQFKQVNLIIHKYENLPMP